MVYLYAASRPAGSPEVSTFPSNTRHVRGRATEALAMFTTRGLLGLAASAALLLGAAAGCDDGAQSYSNPNPNPPPPATSTAPVATQPVARVPVKEKPAPPQP